MNNYLRFRKITFFIAGLLLTLGLVGCASNRASVPTEPETTSEDITDNDENKVITEETSVIDLSSAKLVTEGKLTVGMVVDYPPFEFYPDNGNTPIGIDVDIVSNIAKKLGLELEIKDVPWDDNLFANMGSEYDVVCSAVTITEERMTKMLFSDSYMDNYQSVVIAKDSEIAIEDMTHLTGLKVAVQKNTVSDEFVKELMDAGEINIELIENEVATDCFEQLLNGNVDAIVCDSTVAEGQVARNTETLKEAYRDESRVEQFAVAIASDNEGLKNAINEALGELKEEGTTDKIIKSWFGR